jgi:hypothetical protein
MGPPVLPQSLDHGKVAAKPLSAQGETAPSRQAEDYETAAVRFGYRRNAHLASRTVGGAGVERGASN